MTFLTFLLFWASHKAHNNQFCPLFFLAQFLAPVSLFVVLPFLLLTTAICLFLPSLPRSSQPCVPPFLVAPAPPPRTSPLPLSPLQLPSQRPSSCLASPLPGCSSVWPRVSHTSPEPRSQGRGGSTGQKRKSHPACTLPEVLPSSPCSHLIKNGRGGGGMSRGCPWQPNLPSAGQRGAWGWGRRGRKFSTIGGGTQPVVPAHLVLV